MPTVAVNAAGWRIEPPVSVAVAPMHNSAPTAPRRPPVHPAGPQRGIGALAPPRINHRTEARRLIRRTHRKLVIVEFSQHDGAVAPELRGHRGFVGRHEIAESF